MDPFKEVPLNKDAVINDYFPTQEEVLQKITEDIKAQTKNKREQSIVLNQTLSQDDIRKLKVLDRLHKKQNNKIVR